MNDEMKTIRALNGMKWFIIPVEERKKGTKYVVDHQFKNGPITVNQKHYSSYKAAMDAVQVLKETLDAESFRKSIRSGNR